MAPERRPSIPAELCRRVLVEAGHRCAIHTCRAETVDIHHIDGWASTKEHCFESLIALCPTCHRRADAGEIDRKSLRLYKARLAAALAFQNAPTYPKEVPSSPRFGWADPGARWRTLVYRDSDSARQYIAEIEYPEFAVVGPGLATLNSITFEGVAGLVEWFRQEAVDLSVERGYPSTLGYDFSGSFCISLLTEQLASIRFGVYTFSGGAHGSHWTHVVNATLQPFLTLELPTLFANLEQGLGLLSEYCRKDLLAPRDDHELRDEEWVNSGTEPEVRNFEAFNLTPDGVLVSFDDYRVAPYVDGPSKVLVPYIFLRPALSERVRKVLDEDV